MPYERDFGSTVSLSKPYFRMIADPAARAHVAAVWGVDPDGLPGPGVPAVELLSDPDHVGVAQRVQRNQIGDGGRKGNSCNL